MPTYVVREGDTFDVVSRNVYGEQSKVNLIRRSNPGIGEPLSQGTILNVPVDPNAPTNQPQQLTSNDPAQVSISVKSFVTINKTTLGTFFDESVVTTTEFPSWESVTIKRSLDSLSTIAIVAPFDPTNDALRKFFRPFTFREITVSVGGNTLFVGTIVDILPRLDETRSIVEVTAYSLPGVMNDCQQPSSDYPLTWEGFNLQQIADDVSAAFGVRVIFDDDPGDIFETITNKPTTKALQFLQDLAKQRNLVIGDTREGELLFHKSVQTGSPVARIEQGNSPLVSVTPQFNAQQTFTAVTGINPVTPGVDGEPFTVQTGILGGRYHTYAVKDTENTSLKEAVDAKVGRMYGNMATYKLKVPTWFDPFGTLWSPNRTIKVLAPNAMIYNEYEFIIRSVELQRSAESEAASLDLVLPGSFSGEIPVSLPWE